MTTTKSEAFFMAISGDGPLGIVVVGRDALRRQLSEEFFGPEGPLTPAHVAEETHRWATVCDVDHWEYAHGEPFAWHESGEDYAITITLVTAPLPCAAEVSRMDLAATWRTLADDREATSREAESKHLLVTAASLLAEAHMLRVCADEICLYRGAEK